MEVYAYDGKALQYNGKCISPKASGETWVLNERVNPLSFNQVISFGIDFISNNVNYTLIEFQNSKGGSIWYAGLGGVPQVYIGDDTTGEWTNQAYRTITFATAPTGDLLTWLQANGTKQ